MHDPWGGGHAIDSLLGVDTVLHAGDIVSGLVNLKNQLADARIDEKEFLADLKERDNQLDRLFGQLIGELASPPPPAIYAAALKEAVAQMRQWIENIEVLLRAGLGELRDYPTDWNATHLEHGLILAAKAEQELIDAMAIIHDGHRHPMLLIARNGDFFGELLAARFDRRLSPEEVGAAVNDLRREMAESFDAVLAHLDAIGSTLSNAPSPADASIRQAWRRLKMAEMDVGQALGCLRQPDRQPSEETPTSPSRPPAAASPPRTPDAAAPVGTSIRAMLAAQNRPGGRTHPGGAGSERRGD